MVRVILICPSVIVCGEKWKCRKITEAKYLDSVVIVLVLLNLLQFNLLFSLEWLIYSTALVNMTDISS